MLIASSFLESEGETRYRNCAKPQKSAPATCISAADLMPYIMRSLSFSWTNSLGKNIVSTICTLKERYALS